MRETLGSKNCEVRVNDNKIETGGAGALVSTLHAKRPGHCCVSNGQPVVLLLAVERKKTLNSTEYATNQAQYFFNKKRKKPFLI